MIDNERETNHGDGDPCSVSSRAVPPPITAARLRTTFVAIIKQARTLDCNYSTGQGPRRRGAGCKALIKGRGPPNGAPDIY